MKYSVHFTDDGSPTLVLTTGGDQLWVEEHMHSRFGAASETDYIYGPAIRWAFQTVKIPKFLVVGLGLGYIEFLIARESFAHQKSYEIHSFESDDFLKNALLGWLHEERENPLGAVLDSALKFMSGEHVEQVKEELRALHETGKWKFSGDVSNLSLLSKSNAILYDLFSSKINPELWEEKFLADFLAKAVGEPCAFATYASRVALKKCLKEAGFQQQEMPGYGNKRESTLAFRDLTHREGQVI
jgi:hypothetical protein